MDKEEFRIKVSRIDNLVAQKKYKEAVEVVESIDWRRVKNVHNLCVVGEIYASVSFFSAPGRTTSGALGISGIISLSRSIFFMDSGISS